MKRTPRWLLDSLRDRGLSVRADGGRVLVAPASGLRPEDRADLVRLKAGLLALLAAERPEEGAEGRPGCRRCGRRWARGFLARGVCGECER